LKVDITIPVFNESESLEGKIRELIEFLEMNKYFGAEIDIVIADNGSYDGTQEIAQQLAESIKNVRVVELGVKGVGLALKESWQKSTADIIGYMDLDLATDPNHLAEVIEIFSNSEVDVVNASRLVNGSIVQNRTWLRSLTSRTFNLLLKSTFRTQISDGMCGFKFLKRSKFNDIHSNGANADGWFFATQLLLVSEQIGFQVKEIPVRWKDGGNSKVKVLQLSLQYINEILKLRQHFKESRFKGPLKF
jgi:glycosyltransferase involved in cell wall biosynthesis